MTTYVCIPTTKNDDPNYRYKMPQMRLRQESRLNGVKTNVSNLPDVARALRVPESAILKYFCVEVGANPEGQTIVKGEHRLEDLERHLNKFIMKWVCCRKCKLPEITHEVAKKNLIGVCRSCGNTDSKMDNIHKAGKQLHKDIPTYYSANPEFATKAGPGAAAMESAQAVSTPATGGKKKRRKNAGQAEAAAEETTTVNEEAKRVERAADTNAEVNILDSVNMPLNDPNILNACEELKNFVAEKEADTGSCGSDDILREVRQLQFQLNVTREYKMYIALCGIFGPHRNIAKHWDAFEAVFTSLVAQGEDSGTKHFFQAICQFFINLHPEMQKFAAALCKKLYDNSVIEDSFFTAWHDKSMKLDRDCILHDRKAETAMRKLLAEFIGWLTSAEYDEEEAYGEEEETKNGAANQEEEKEEEPAETEAQRAQRELIERQKKQQAEQMEKARAAGAEQKAKAAAQAEEEAKEAEAEAAANLGKIEQTTKVADIAVEDDFDINDI